MKKYRFSVDGRAVTVFSVSGLDGVRTGLCSELIGDELAVVIRPSEEVDVFAECFDKNNENVREPQICLAALSCLFESVLSYPKMTMDCQYNGSKFVIDISRPKDHGFCFNMAKSKILCTKSIEFSDGIPLDAAVIGRESGITVLTCSDAELFDLSRLSLVFRREAASGISSCAAVSYGDVMCLRCVGNATSYGVIAACVSLLSDRGCTFSSEMQSALLNDTEYLFSYNGHQISFYPRTKYLS